jgi:hypothetical protein
VCIEWTKGTLTSEEAMRALAEMIVTNDEYNYEANAHFFETSEKIKEKEDEDKGFKIKK